jgi:hypothetical protein
VGEGFGEWPSSLGWRLNLFLLWPLTWALLWDWNMELLSLGYHRTNLWSFPFFSRNFIFLVINLLCVHSFEKNHLFFLNHWLILPFCSIWFFELFCIATYTVVSEVLLSLSSTSVGAWVCLFSLFLSYWPFFLKKYITIFIWIVCNIYVSWLSCQPHWEVQIDRSWSRLVTA